MTMLPGRGDGPPQRSEGGQSFDGADVGGEAPAANSAGGGFDTGGGSSPPDDDVPF